MIVIHLFGQCVIRTPATLMQSQMTKLFSLTLYCAAYRGRRLPRETIATLLWPLADPPARRQRLRTALSRLRRLGVPIRDDGRAGRHVWIDADDVVMADAFLHTEAPEQLRQRDLRVLPGLDPADNEPLRDWLDDFRFETQRTLVEALEQRMMLAERGHETQLTAALADLLLGVDPRHAIAHATALRLRAPDTPRRARAPLHTLAPSLVGTHRTLGNPTSDRRRLGCIHLPEGGTPDMAPIHYALHRLTRGTGGAMLLWGASEPERASHARAIQRLATAARIPTVAAGATPSPFGFFSAVAQPLAALPGAAGCDPDRVEWIRALVTHGAGTPFPVARHQLRALRDALLDLVDAVADEQPLIFVVDKADALDDASAAIFDTMLEWTAKRPIGVFFTAAYPWDLATGCRARRRHAPAGSADAPRYWTARRRCGTVSPSSDGVMCENSSL